VSFADQWALLGIAPTDDKRDVKRAYTRKLKAIDVDSDPSAFIALREAMEAALDWGTNTPWWEQDHDQEDCDGDFASDAHSGNSETAEEEPDDAFDGDWQNWRPSRPVFADEGPGPVIAELEDLLYADDRPDPAQVEALGARLLARAELDRVDQAVAVEEWLAQAIANSFPRSDPLIEPAAERFGWKEHARLSDWAVGQIMQRRDDLRFRQRLSDPLNPHRRAFEELAGPPRNKLRLLEWGLADQVSDFFTLLHERPTLESDLDSASVAWWRGHFVGPHLPRHFGWWWGGLAMLLAIGGMAALKPDANLPLVFAALLGAAAGLTFAAIQGWAQLAAWHRRERDRRWDEEPAQATPLYASLALALPLIAAFLPPLWPAAAVSVLLTLILGWKILRSGWISPDWADPSNRPRVFLPVVAGICGTAGAMQLPAAGAVLLGFPLLLAAWSGSYYYGALRQSVTALPARRRVPLVVAAAALLLLASAALAVTSEQDVRPAFVFALVPIAILGSHFAGAFSDVDVHAFEWPLRFLLAVAYFGARSFWPVGFLAIVFAIVGCYGLGYALLRLLMVLKEEAGAARR
jgi:hypothetical protein